MRTPTPTMSVVDELIYDALRIKRQRERRFLAAVMFVSVALLIGSYGLTRWFVG